MPRARPLAVLPTALTAALALAVGCALLVVWLRPKPGDSPPPGAALPASGALGDPPARRVLREWDAARAAAYAEGSVPALRRLYAGGAGATDVRVLRAYLRRGLRVEEMTVQVLGLEVLREQPGELLVGVTDRLSHAVAVGAHGRTVLPRDRASTRVVHLVRQGGRWRVSMVRDASAP